MQIAKYSEPETSAASKERDGPNLPLARVEEQHHEKHAHNGDQLAQVEATAAHPSEKIDREENGHRKSEPEKDPPSGESTAGGVAIRSTRRVNI